jgi:hypothetical protein
VGGVPEMKEIPAEEWSALEQGLDAHDRAPLIGSLFVKLLVAAGYSDSEIRLAASTMVSYVD